MIFPIFHIPSKFEAETSVSASTLLLSNQVVIILNNIGIYIHVPFCDGKCNYCDFYSFKANAEELDEYTKILKEQIIIWGQKLYGRSVDTIYFGGGTPSLLGTYRLSEVMDSICNSFKIDSDCEITLEANPTSAGDLDFSGLKSRGFNRVSLGMQSSNDEELKLLGRRHLKTDVIKSVESIRKNGIDNLSLDVMLGIPQQSENSLLETLRFCVSLDVPHISTYMLSIEPDTVFGKHREKFSFANDDEQAKFFMLTSDYLKNMGYRHYEISNFCKDDKFSRHNMRYWQLKDYLGLGPSAYSLIDTKRFYYPNSVESFRNGIIIEDGEGKTKEEYIMLMLRTDEGVNFAEYENMFSEKLSPKFIKKADIYEKLGYVKVYDNSVKLTERGFLLSNTIIADLI